MSIKVYILVCSTSQILIPSFVTGQKQRTATKQIKIKSNLQKCQLQTSLVSQCSALVITEPLAAQLHYYLEYFSLQRRTLGFHICKALSVPLCSTNIFQLSGKVLCALAAVRWDSKSKCLVLNWLMSPSLWLLRDCFVAPAWKRSKHKAKPQHSLNSFTALSSAGTWTEVVDFIFVFLFFFARMA